MSPPLPVVRAADIAAASVTKSHFLNPAAARQSAAVSDLAPGGGMDSCPLWLNQLEPGAESTEMHHHLTDSEWLYILSGTAELRLTPADARDTSGGSGLIGATETAPIETVPVAEGDYVAFPAGELGGGYWAHTLIGGPGGVKYLVGGMRSASDVCVYPLKGKTLFIRRPGTSRAIVDTDLLEPLQS
ncbi:hypothetical protein Q8F55_004848 [Vanrija albida]|uniref:Cupin type-1 domain-containing protein n=1 Tax=Vanrija albida TaxID=181172 RepID=A0ABR3Q028_9TREE